LLADCDVNITGSSAFESAIESQVAAFSDFQEWFCLFNLGAKNIS
jgi:hypothetical protein